MNHGKLYLIPLRLHMKTNGYGLIVEGTNMQGLLDVDGYLKDGITLPSSV